MILIDDITHTNNSKYSVVCDIMTHLDLGSSIKLPYSMPPFQHFSYGFKQKSLP